MMSQSNSLNEYPENKQHQQMDNTSSPHNITSPAADNKNNTQDKRIKCPTSTDWTLMPYTCTSEFTPTKEHKMLNFQLKQVCKSKFITKTFFTILDKRVQVTYCTTNRIQQFLKK